MMVGYIELCVGNYVDKKELGRHERSVKRAENGLYCIDSTFALQSCVYTQASLVPLPHRATS